MVSKTVAASILSALMAAPVSGGTLDNELAKTSRQVYRDMRSRSQHPHMVYKPDAKAPYVIDAYTIPCGEGHAQCPNWTGMITYDPVKQRSYVIEYVDGHVETSIVNGRVPDLSIFMSQIAPLQEAVCGGGEGWVDELRTAGLNPNRVMAYISKEKNGAGKLDQKCARGSESQQKELFRDYLSKLQKVPQMYREYHNSLPKAIKHRPHRTRRH